MTYDYYKDHDYLGGTTPEPHYDCPHCDRSFDDMWDLNKHIENEHKNQ
jgi:uncharacterized C2H2 Zn-finger protein